MSGRVVRAHINRAEAHRLLSILCTKYGFTLPPLWMARLQDNPPHSVGKFTDTVFLAEGLDPITSDSELHESVLREVRGAFERSASESDDGWNRSSQS